MNKGNVKEKDEVKVTEEVSENNEKKEKVNVAEKETNNKTKSTIENKSDNKETKNGPVRKVLNILAKVVEGIIWVFIVILLVLLVMSTVSKRTDVLGHRLYVIMSGSMEPTIMTKQAIITKQIDEPQVGDVIAFGENDFITVHRVIKVHSEGGKKLYQTKGDNNNAEDKELVKQEQIKGKVQFILPGVGETILFLQQHLILLVVAIGVIIMIILIRRLIF